MLSRTYHGKCVCRGGRACQICRFRQLSYLVHQLGQPEAGGAGLEVAHQSFVFAVLGEEDHTGSVVVVGVIKPLL